MQELKKHIHFNISQIILLGFAAVVLTGSLLLMLPISSRAHTVTPWIDTLFTATSAVCVTGLIVHDSATYWSFFGQLVILTLIQIGGMGVVTVASLLSMLLGKRIGLFQRSIMQESIAAHKVGGIVRLMGFIVRLTILVEGLGALLLFPVFLRDFGFLKGLWYSVFHSISAFCNAGFDLMGIRTPFSSLVTYQDNVVVNLVITTLIITGGIGFLTLEDLRSHGLKWSAYSLQTKGILVTTGLLLLGSFLYFFTAEFSGEPWLRRTLFSWFAAVTPRTAGFNTIDYNSLSGNGIFLTIVLMLIGGSPGSTAGGMKTTTLLVLLVSAHAVFTRKPQPGLFRRRFPLDALRNSAAIFLMYSILFGIAAMMISAAEKVPLSTAMFESASAIGTVGLTLGITPGLHLISKIILISLMFFGRVGGLTLIFAAVPSVPVGTGLFPEERINVG